MHIEELDEGNQQEVRELILSGLVDHWGSIDETLNPDLVDMVSSYGHGRTVLVRAGDGSLVGTGTIVPGRRRRAEIVRMSVARDRQRSGIGRQIVSVLVATARTWAMESVVLETSSAWEDVIRFYLSCGFEITHTEDGDFGSDTWFERRLDAAT